MYTPQLLGSGFSAKWYPIQGGEGWEHVAVTTVDGFKQLCDFSSKDICQRVCDMLNSGMSTNDAIETIRKEG